MIPFKNNQKLITIARQISLFEDNNNNYNTHAAAPWPIRPSQWFVQGLNFSASRLWRKFIQGLLQGDKGKIERMNGRIEDLKLIAHVKGSEFGHHKHFLSFLLNCHALWSIEGGVTFLVAIDY